jgi:TAG lipase / steryl ester hydrolase / phospholipase A2 / LPA acyltransferase
MGVWVNLTSVFSCAGRILNVSICPADTNEPPRVLNYLTAPHVLVWSAVACSSAFPLLFLPQKLYARNAQGEQVE